MQNDLSFAQLHAANVCRCEESFFPLSDWTPTDWACAMAGEVGEACNLVKKLRRMEDEDSPYNQSVRRGHSMHQNAPCAACGDLDGCHMPARLRTEKKDINRDIGKELADVIIYADLLAARLGIDLEEVITAKFNEVSKRVGSPIRLGEVTT